MPSPEKTPNSKSSAPTSSSRRHSLDRDIKTIGYVLRRTNYGEADRILDLITPLGKFSVLARGARKSRSKLAGGIEMYTLSDFNIHRGRGGLDILTGARMRRFYSNFLTDPAKMELAVDVLRRISRAAEHTDSSEHFALVDQSLASINAGRDLRLIKAWFLINLCRIMGEELNLYRDLNGEKLLETQNYTWHSFEKAFTPSATGPFSSTEIKLLRLMDTSELSLLFRIKITPEILDHIEKLTSEL